MEVIGPLKSKAVVKMGSDNTFPPVFNSVLCISISLIFECHESHFCRVKPAPCLAVPVYEPSIVMLSGSRSLICLKWKQKTCSQTHLSLRAGNLHCTRNLWRLLHPATDATEINTEFCISAGFSVLPHLIHVSVHTGNLHCSTGGIGIITSDHPRQQKWKQLDCFTSFSVLSNTSLL